MKRIHMSLTKSLIVFFSIADKYGISCIYDNHQCECSSYFGRGIGFPNSVLTQSFGLDPPPTRNSSGQPCKHTLKEFWNRWWDRKLKITGGEICNEFLLFLLLRKG